MPPLWRLSVPSRRSARSVTVLNAALLCATCIISVSASAAAPGNQTSDAHLLDQLTWGATETDAARLHDMGPEKWLQWQLHPPQDSDLPPAAQQQIAALPISRQPMASLVADLADQIKTANQIPDPTEKLKAQQAYQQAMTEVARQAAIRDILRDLYAPAQLRERMAWFWFNHFNVHQYKADIRPMIADYEEQAIRPHALGRFRDLLEATLRHPAMLRYLDNAQNAAGHINENYAREIMELHTMGVGAGYTQRDVEELARILTGAGIDPSPNEPKLKPELQSKLLRDGLFEFNPARHDFGDKLFLGHVITGSGFSEIQQALDILSREPATAHHIAAELAVYFVADDPPPALVDRMTQAFTRTDGDIPAVLLAMVHSPEFAAAAGTRFKDPLRYVLSAVRLAYDGRVIRNTAPIQYWLARLGQSLFNHDTPDGFSLASSAWNGPGQLATRFEMARQIGFSPFALFKPETPGAVDEPAFPQLQNALYFASTRETLTPATRASLDQALSPQEWNFLFLCSPEFMN